MSAEKLIQTLDKLLKLHQNLYEVTLQKTEMLKQNQVEELRELLKKEQMYVQAIKQVEDERVRKTAEYLGGSEEVTLSACINKATGSEKEVLQNILTNFTNVMDYLKNQNQLNKELTKQALQLTSITLDTLFPKETNVNYDKPLNKPLQEKQRRSIFDSKA
ncbi:flagellar protein FlgN [Metabacillus halosaccharovorans]|uniref:flagellar protein FlgN n=1 Tax=Metabacillus halosaccharovorans TaxID=930124 RepID=UPI003735600C